MRFGRWGADLDADAFAKAFAAAGVLATSQQLEQGLKQKPASALLATLVGDAHAREEPLRWANPLLPPRWPTFADVTAAAELAAAWPGVPVRFALASDSFDDDGLEPTWTTRMLTSPAVGGRSAMLLSPRSTGGSRPRRWEWTLRVGFLPDGASSRLQRDVAEARQRLPMLRAPTTLHRVGASPSCDLLLLPMTLRQALPALLRTQVSSAFVVFTGTSTGRWRHTEPLLAALRSVTKASVVAVAAAGDPVQWLEALVEGLSGDAPFDVAFSLADRRTASGGLLVVEEFSLARARASQQPAPAGMVAGEVPRAGRRAREYLEPAEPRWLQARVFADVVGSGRPLETFAADALHAVNVRVGLAEADWHALASPLATDELPQQDAPHRLTVVLTEPTLLDEPLTGELLLPRVGSSAPTTFLLRTRPDTTVVDAHIIVAYGNRVLQTARLRGGVPGRAEDPRIRLEPETAVRLGTSDLAERRRFDAALVLGDGLAGTPRATALVDAKAVVVDLDDSDLAKTTERIRARFEEIIEAPDDFTTLQALRRGQCRSQEVGGQRLQVVAARPEASFP